jgi:hypothetical protein
MKKYHVSSGYIDRAIKIIEVNCFSNMDGSFCGAELQKFCKNPKNLYTLNLLEASGEIRMAKTNNSEMPYAVWLENKGMLHAYTKWEKRIASIKGFLAGVLSTTIIPYIFELLVTQLPR